MLIDQRHQPPEVLAGTVCIEGRPVRPLFDKNKVSGILFVPEQIIGNTQGFLSRCRDEFAVERENGVDRFGFDKIFGNDF
ncbi:hypothetical protein D3C75_1081810 [compost metagenome]